VGFERDPVRVGFERDPVRVGFERDPVRVGFERDPVRVGFERDPVRVGFEGEGRWRERFRQNWNRSAKHEAERAALRAAEGMASDADGICESARSLPMPERFAHGLWKARMEAYEEVLPACRNASDGQDQVLVQVGPLMPKAIQDANVAAQDKALELMVAVLEKVDENYAAKYGKEVSQAIVKKTLAGRASIVDKANQIMMLLVELEAVDHVLEATITKGITNKVPKAQLAAVNILVNAVSLFGTRVVPAKPIVQAVPNLYTAKDAKVRDGVKSLIAALIGYVGKAPLEAALLSKMSDAMRKDLESLLETMEPMQPLRMLRKEMHLPAPMDVEEEGHSSPMSCAAEEETDQDNASALSAYDLAEPVDVAKQIPQDFLENARAAKWSVRRDAFQNLFELSSTPKIAPGEFRDVVSEIKKVVSKDSNVAVITWAVKCLGNLAEGLRTAFQGHAKSTCSSLFEKFKDKNGPLVAACRTTLELYVKYCVNAIDILDDAVAAFNHKNPKVRALTGQWLAGVVSNCSRKPAIDLQRILLPICAKGTADSDAAVRAASFEIIAAFARKQQGLHFLDRVADQIDDSKKKTLMQMLGSVEENSAPERSTSNQGASSSKPGQSNQVSRVSSRPLSALQRRNGPKRMPSQGSLTRSKAGDTSQQPGGLRSATEIEKPQIKPIPIEELTSTLGLLIGPAVLENLKSASWKDRLEAAGLFLESVKEMIGENLDRNTRALVRFLAVVPGWAEKNFQVMSKVIEVFSFLASSSGSFDKPEAYVILEGIVERAADPKLKGPCGECFSLIAEAVGPDFVFSTLHEKAAAQKNPKVLCDVLGWMGFALQEFGGRCVETAKLVGWLRMDLQSTNAAVRNAAIGVLGILHRFHGASIKAFLTDVKPALMSSIDLAFSKYPYEGSNTSPPKRSVRCEQKLTAEMTGQVCPRADISEQITRELLAQLGSPNWKERQAALQDVSKILEENNFSIEPSVGDLMPALRARLADTNKNLIVAALSTLGLLSRAMGPGIDKHTKLILPDGLKNVNDNKKTVREAVLRMSEDWNNATDSEKTLTYMLGASDDHRISADGRADLLTWLSLNVRHKNFGLSLAQEVLKVGSRGLTDKTPQVRDAASELIGAYASLHGKDVFDVASSGIGSERQGLVLACLERYGLYTSEPKTPLPTSVPASKKQAVTASKSESRISRTASKSSSIRLAEQMNAATGPLLMPNGLKEERARKFVVGRMKFEEPRSDATETLQKDMSGFVREDVLSGLFSADFKVQCKNMEMLKGCAGDTVEELIGNLDLLFRLVALKMCEGNMQVLVKSIELGRDILNVLYKSRYQLLDFEAAILVPCIVEKSGHNQDRIKKLHRELLRHCAKIHPPVKVFSAVVEGLQSKNNRTKVECVEELGHMIEAHGLEIVGKTAIASIVALVAERDATLRSAALNTLAIVYALVGEDIWRLAGRVNDAQKSLMEEKFKYKAKQLARQGIVIGQKGTRSEAKQALSQQHSYKVEELVHTNFDRHYQFQPHGESGTTPNARWPTPEARSLKYSPSAEPLLEELERSLLQIRSADAEENIEGMKVFCHELMQVFTGEEESGRLAIFARITDDFVSVLVKRIRSYFDLVIAGRASSTRACKYVLNSLMQVFQSLSLSEAVLESTLRELLVELLSLLLDQDLPTAQEGTQLLKAINVLALKVLENAKPDYSFSILLSFLRQPRSSFMGKPISDPKAHSDLVIRCLIKLTKGLPSYIHILDKESLLLSIHAFLLSSSVKGSAESDDNGDQPLRMVKTILFVMTKLLGPEIRGFLSRVPRDIEPAPAIHTIIDMNLDKLYSAGTLAREADTPNIQTNDTDAPISELNQQLKAELAIVFKKIGEKSTTSEGLENLYDFKKANPQVDISKHLAKTSDAFRLYIERGLARVEAQRQSNQRRSQLNELNHSEVRSSLASLEERMKQIRQRDRYESNKDTLNSEAKPNYTLDDIKSRIDRIRGEPMRENSYPQPGISPPNSSAFTLEQLQRRMAQLQRDNQ